MSIAVNFVNKLFGTSNVKSLENIDYVFNNKFKIVVFVPPEKADEITFAMASAGAGQIGKYTVCSFRTKGTGTFLGGEGTNPYTGQKGRFEKVDEIRLEMICSAEKLNNAIDKMYKVHAYEEPAYEIYKVIVRQRKPSDKIVEVKLKKAVQLKSILGKINNLIDSDKISSKLLNAELKEAIIDFSLSDEEPKMSKSRNKVLYITKNSNRSVKIQLI